MTAPTAVLERLSRTTDQIIGEQDLLSRLGSGRSLRIKFGVDCTAPDLHLGHAVNLWMMRQLQELGHTVVFLLGDTTTRIGDPSGRNTTRPTLTPEQIDTNAAAFLDQVSLVLRTDPDVLEIRRNSEWFDQLPLTDLLAELSHVSVAQLMGRDMFSERTALGLPVAAHELIYPVLQGFDSVQLESDLTIVGTDQLFNEAMGRQIQARHGQQPQTVITSVITPGLDGGAKQSKSLNNYVGLTDPPEEKFGRLMTLRDDLIAIWGRVYTDRPIPEVEEWATLAERGGGAARDAKLALAEAIVARHHGTDAARRARQEFVAVFSGRELPDDLPVLEAAASVSLWDLAASARDDLSRTAVRRLITDGAVRLDEVAERDPFRTVEIRDNTVLQVGRRKWFRLRRRPGGPCGAPAGRRADGA